MSPKRKMAEGAPAYIQLYSTMMILLLAFFIVLVTLSEDQEAGFSSGIGEVQDAFGIAGGIGMLTFHFTAGAPPAKEPKTPVTQNEGRGHGVEPWRLRGSGGTGASDTDFEKGMPRCLRILVPYRFEEGSARLTPEMAEYLDIAGTILALHLDFRITVRQFSDASETEEAPGSLANRRAAAVQQFLHQSCKLTPKRMTAIGYAHDTYLHEYVKANAENTGQMLVFDLYPSESKE